MARIAGLIAALALTGCQLDKLFAPLPVYVWACVEWQTVTVRDSTGAAFGSVQFCRREDWTRRVDTLETLPL